MQTTDGARPRRRPEGGPAAKAGRVPAGGGRSQGKPRRCTRPPSHAAVAPVLSTTWGRRWPVPQEGWDRDLAGSQASIPGRRPQLCHQSPRVDGASLLKDSRMICLHCSLKKGGAGLREPGAASFSDLQRFGWVFSLRLSSTLAPSCAPGTSGGGLAGVTAGTWGMLSACRPQWCRTGHSAGRAGRPAEPTPGRGVGVEPPARVPPGVCPLFQGPPWRVALRTGLGDGGRACAARNLAWP